MNGLIPEPIFRYKAHYKAKPGFESVGSGFNGPFDLLQDAVKQAQKTKAYFDTERTRVERMPERGGKLEVTIQERVLDKVEVWIDEYKDGWFHRRLDEEGKPWRVQPKTENESEKKKELVNA